MSKKKDRFEKHHRRPSSIGGRNEDWNSSNVPKHKHVAWHILFKNMTAQEIVAEINKTWLDSHFKCVLMPQFPSQLNIAFGSEEEE